MVGMTKNMRCIFIKKNNEQCNAHKMFDSTLCFRHNPKHVTKALKASKTGGENRSVSIAFQEEIMLNTTHDLKQFIGKVINGVWQGKIPTKVGSSLGFLTRCWLDAYEKAELETRVADLEKKIATL